MYGGVGLFAEALGVTEKEFLKMMETGQLMSADVMPKLTKRMHEFVRENGALAKSMETVNAQQGRFETALTGTKEALFKGGMGEGMAYFFKISSSFLNDITPLMKVIGAVIKGVISTLTGLAKVLLLPLNLLSDFFDMLKAGGPLAVIAGGTGALALIVARVALLRAVIWSLNTALAVTLGRLALIALPAFVAEDVYVGLKGGDALSKDLSNKMSWTSNHSIMNPMSTMFYKLVFDAGEFSKLIKVEQASNSKDANSVLESQLN